MTKKRTKRLWTDADLREWFDLANARYFHNRLEVRYLSYGALPPKMHAIGNTHRITYRTLYGPPNPDPPVHWSITICRTLRNSRSLSVMTLLHEMVHLEQENQFACGAYGWKFNRRMKELAAAGAFNGFW
jgi:hypothetical protein